MIKKIRNWLQRHRADYIRGYQDGKISGEDKFRGQEVYTRQQVENAFKLGYTDGKRDGLTIARQQATKSLKEILWEQNQQIK